MEGPGPALITARALHILLQGAAHSGQSRMLCVIACVHVRGLRDGTAHLAQTLSGERVAHFLLCSSLVAVT